MRPWRVVIVLVFGAVCALGYRWCRNEVRTDECLDSGGRWNGVTCEH